MCTSACASVCGHVFECESRYVYERISIDIYAMNAQCIVLLGVDFGCIYVHVYEHIPVELCSWFCLCVQIVVCVAVCVCVCVPLCVCEYLHMKISWSTHPCNFWLVSWFMCIYVCL